MAAPIPLTIPCLTLLNIITLLLSIPLLGLSIWLATTHEAAHCFTFHLQWPYLLMGAAMLVASLLGLMGNLKRKAMLLWAYLLIFLLTILLLFSFTAFIFAVTSGGKGESVSGARFREYSTSQFSPWLRTHMGTHGRWQNIKHCLQTSSICTRLDKKYPVFSQFCRAKLSGVESGCCKPPVKCGYEFVGPIIWVNGTHEDDGDCRLWSNRFEELCYECDSCHAGVMKEVQKEWHKVGKASITLLVLLIIFFALACFTFSIALKENLFGNMLLSSHSISSYTME